MPTRDINFCCPSCLSTLKVNDRGLCCEQCKREYPVEEGIFDLRLSNEKYYFNPVPRQQMQEITNSMLITSWHKTIQRLMESANYNPNLIHNLIKDGRYAWKFFLDLPENATVLDFGCGLGSLTKNLASHVKKVIAMDLSYEHLEFASKRSDIFNQGSDITFVAGGDGEHLPFADGSIDSVILSGELERVPDIEDLWNSEPSKIRKLTRAVTSYFGKNNPRKLQLALLLEIKRVLKPDGQLFIGIENRLNYKYFGGRPDHHSGLPYGSLLPRFIANLYSICRNHRPYRTYTYSMNGYENLLQEAGFTNNIFYGLFESYSHFKRAIPLKTNSKYFVRRRPSSLKQKIKEHNAFVPAYGVVAQKSTDIASCLLDRIVDLVCDLMGVSASEVRAIDDFFVSGKNKLILCAVFADVSYIIKIPLNSDANNAEENNFDFIKLINGAAISSHFPSPKISSNYQGANFYVEEKVEGRPFKEVLRVGDGAQQLKITEEYFQNLKCSKFFSTSSNGFKIIQPDLVLSITELLELIDRQEAIEELTNYISSRLYEKQVGVGIYHGDFSVSNVYITQNGRVRIIDSEDAKTQGISIMDAINLVESALRTRTPELSLKDTTELLKKNDIPVIYQEFLNNCYEILATDRSIHSDLVNLYWLNHISSQIKNGLKFNTMAIEEKIVGVIRDVIPEWVDKLQLETHSTSPREEFNSVVSG